MKDKIRQSGHLIDQKLKYTTLYNKKKPALELSMETLEKMDGRLDVRAEGIRLTPAQDKLITAFFKLLHEKSENRNTLSNDFYAGNEESQLVLYGGGGQTAVSAVIRMSRAELYKAYLGSKDYSGADIKFIDETLQETSQIKFLIIYDRTRKISNTGKQVEKRIDRIEDFQPLFTIKSYFENLTEDEAAELDKGNAHVRKKRGEIIILLNPLLTDQIATKYVEYPSDINKRTVIAAGDHRRVTESLIAFRDYMLREISNKRFFPEMNEETLTLILKLENYLRSNRRAKVREKIENAVQFGKNLGLIKSCEVVEGAHGQTKYIFRINREFE